jgi:tetratricopeptide (TPR) repeat protein
LAAALPLVCTADVCHTGAEALNARDLKRAEVLLERCVQQDSATVESYLMLCGLYQLQQDSQGLYRVALEGLKKFPDEKRFYLTVGTHEARQKRYEEAVETLAGALRRWPQDSKLKSLLASSHFAQGSQLLDKGQNEAAVKHLEAAAALAPDDVEAQLNLGRALHNLLRHTEALAAFDKALALDPSLPLVHFHRGLSLYSLGEFDASAKELAKEIERNPDYPPAHLVRGLSLLATADWSGALADLEIAATKMPDSAKAQYSRARALVQLGKIAEAEEGLRKAAALEPGDPAPLNTLVTVLMRLGRTEEARRLAARAAEVARDRRTADPGEIRFESFRRPGR